QRKPIPGYPWNGKFRTMDEINEYLDRAKVTCLLCGYEFVLLSQHLNSAHDMPPDSYKQTYGLPWTTPLAGTGHREAMGVQMKKTHASGRLPRRPTPEHLEKLSRSHLRRRPPVEASTNARLRHLEKARAQKKRVKTAPEKMEEYLRRIATGRTPRDVGRDED